jgi:hypothetical protein
MKITNTDGTLLEQTRFSRYYTLYVTLQGQILLATIRM